MKIRAFWDAAPCILVGADRCFRDVYCLYYQAMIHCHGMASFAVKGFWALWDGLLFIVCVIIVAVIWRSFAVQEFWALWNNIYDCVFTTLDFPTTLGWQFTSNYVFVYADIFDFLWRI
jgi:hypothetical protein